MSAIERIEKELSDVDYSKQYSVFAQMKSALSEIALCIPDFKREIEQDKRDAERYREIKDGYQSGKEIEVHKRKYSFKLQFTNYEYEVFNSLDEAIDAAIAAKKEGV